ncbi:hypothetical protein C0991_006435 [Blastosporella zonata]|nr:hypothetical protein C0991_006435 [Blastosporella zonata]
MVPLRAHTLPRVLREKAGPVVEIKPDTKQRWNWRLLTKERPTRSSPSLRPSTSSALISNKGASAPSVAASPWGSSFEPTPSLSTILPSDPQHLTLPSRGSIVRLDDDDLLPNPKPSPRNSTNKLARTLGALPPQSDYDDINKPLPNLGSSSRQDIAGSRRMSLSLTTTFTAVPALLRQASRTGPKQSRSKTTLSTLTTDDVFGLADDLSDNWGEPRTGSRASIYSSYSPISPIVFNPPTPTTTKPPRRLPSADNMKLEDVTFASRPHPGATLNRSRSLSFAPLRPKITRLAHLASAGAQAETRPQSVMASPSIPLKAGWLESTPAVLEEEASKARSFVVTHPEYVDEYRNWSGQWNQDNVQDVIKMLRNLK